MWSIPRFQTWLEETYGRADLWQCLLQPAMKHVVICTLKCAQDLIAARKGSCQLYGYDFLIDDQLRVVRAAVRSLCVVALGLGSGRASSGLRASLCRSLLTWLWLVAAWLRAHLSYWRCHVTHFTRTLYPNPAATATDIPPPHSAHCFRLLDLVYLEY